MNITRLDTDVVAIYGVDKAFAATRVVDSLTLRIRRGETVAMLGPNGAGKTTSIAMMLGLLQPDAGPTRATG